jgi:ATP-dependent exoDNAse (exonuclease V) beta subunit
MNQKLYLADQAQRETARGDLDRSFSVEAGAGTGKTTLLVERILSLIRNHRASLEQIVAITFTEKAAGELKVRLREAIEKAIPLASAEEGEVLAQALEDLERASISTIHSFCASLLRERPVEASIDPNFEPLDEIGMDLLFQETWDQWLGQELEKKARELRRALALGMNLDSLARLVRQVYDNRDLLPADPFRRPAYSTVVFLESLEREVQKAWELAESDCRDEQDLGYQSIQALRQKIKELKEASPDRREIILLRDLEIKSQGNKQKWKKPTSCDVQKQILKGLGVDLMALLVSIRSDVMAELLEWVRAFLMTIQEEKNRRGLLDFQDLLILARNLLRDNKEIRRYFQERFRYILVDEFQDTDPLQVEVVFLLAEDGARAENWEEVAVLPGKLFLVGDPKQSIYRFRRADIETYEKAKEKLTVKGASLNIVQNFRTVPSIISWVNRIFTDLIQPTEEGHFQPSYTPLAPHPERKEVLRDQPGVILLAPTPGFEPLEASAPQVREGEAQSIAALIEEMVGENSRGRWMVFDKKEGGSRPVGFRDMALLFPTLTGIEAYEEALKARSIPYRLEGGKEFYLRQEVRSLLCCLKALDDPADEISLVAALRSPFFGFSDEEIFLFASSGNRLNYLHSPDEEGSGFAETFSLLRKLHEERNANSLSSTVTALLSGTKALEFSLLRQGGEQVAANLRKILEQARMFEGESQATFRRFVEWLETREEEGVREGESPWAEEGEESVKLLTVHKAKGLEFPVVFLANLASQRVRRQEFIPLRLQGTFQLAIGGFKTAGYDSALKQEKARMEAEDRRLFYVAATRARDYLVIPLFWGKRKGFFSLLEGKVPGMDEMHPWSVVDGQLIAGGGCFDLQPAEKPPLRLDLGESERERETPWQRRIHWKETLDSVKEKASRGLPLLAPSSSAFLDFPPYFFDEKTEPRASGKGSEESGLYFGLAFHAVMERLDLASGSNLGDLSRVKAMDQSIPGLAEKIETLCRRCLDHPLMERARKSKRIFREVPFSVSLNDNIVEGKIDLLFEEGGSWAIVDYKTDDVSGESLEQRFQSYQEQGTWYARAVHQATGGKVKEVTFFFVRSGEVRTIKLQG